MPIHRGSFSSSVALLPVVVAQPASNFNQDRSTFSAYVNTNGYNGTVYFDWSTSPSFSSYSILNNGTVNGSNVFTFINHTGLSPGTIYYYRCRVVTPVGETIGASNSFTTWSLKTYTKTDAGSFSVSIPSITPYGGSPIAPTVYEMLLYGAGGGANYGGGGGGGYRIFSSHVSSVGGTQTISGSVGAGGAAGNGGTGTGTATTGGSTSLTIGSSTWVGGGGTAGQHPGVNGAPNGRGGTVGTGDNGANLGGTNTYGYYYFTGNYVCVASDKFGNCTAYDYNQPIYAWNAGYYACGGGGGTNFYGLDAYTQGTNSHNGGNGGNGGGAYGLRGGNGGGGYGTQSSGIAGLFNASLTGTIVGTGGSHFGAGLAGGITFKYYGP
jgi:hypothetical protein